MNFTEIEALIIEARDHGLMHSDSKEYIEKLVNAIEAAYDLGYQDAYNCTAVRVNPSSTPIEYIETTTGEIVDEYNC